VPSASAPDRAAFAAAYDAAVAAWPIAPSQLDVPTPFGSTHVLAVGNPAAPPVVLLPGGGATATVWSATAAALAPAHRVYAVDTIGDVGRSGLGRRRPRRPSDLAAWFAALLDGLDAAWVGLVGHSYGGWVATTCALAVADRVGRLALLDPTDVFAGLAPAYLAHALPLLVRPSPARAQALLRWETGPNPPPPLWARVYATGTVVGPSAIVRPRRPSAATLSTLAPPTLVVLAGESRAHDPARIAEQAPRRLPAAEVAVLPGVSHHGMPLVRSAELDAMLVPFLA